MARRHARSLSASTYAEFGPRGLKGWPGREQFSDEKRIYEVEDLATAFIRLDSGATLLLEASWATHSSAGDDFGVTLYGTEGGVELMVRNYTHENTVRVFTDLVPSSVVDVEPGAAGLLAELEEEVAERPDYLALGSQVHALARRP